MSKRLDGTSIFANASAGLTNIFTQLSSQYGDDVTLENINKALTNSNTLNNNIYNNSFASYISGNFSSFDQNSDGKISADEIQNIMSQMARQGLTREQIIALGASSGMTTSLQETVLSHFDEIDKNKDGKVTNQEIQAYGVESDFQKQKTADRNRLLNSMSMYYDVSSDESSLLDYKYLSDENS
jgi:Ca2+-binding EF-hand superfamily protein